MGCEPHRRVEQVAGNLRPTLDRCASPRLYMDRGKVTRFGGFEMRSATVAVFMTLSPAANSKGITRLANPIPP